MAPNKTKSMPSMKELQEVLAALESEGNITMGNQGEPAPLDELFDDSYFYHILHGNVKRESFEIAPVAKPPSATAQTNAGDEDDKSKDGALRELTSTSTLATLKFEVITLPQGCSWGDDPDVYGARVLVRPGFTATLNALNLASSNQTSSSSPSSPPQLVFMAVGPRDIGRSSLCYYLVHEFFKAGQDVVFSDPIFTSALIDQKYYGCYTPQIDKHETIHRLVTSQPSLKPVWWICDDGWLPIKGTQCHVLVTSLSNQADADWKTIHKKRKLPRAVQFHIPKWSSDEIKAGLIVTLANVSAKGDSSRTETVLTDMSLDPEQESLLNGLYGRFQGNPRSTFEWAMLKWGRKPPAKPAKTKKTTTPKKKI
ncbi:hypothetical protein BGZ98_000019 [Dissophora globulifera]|nr:hypothetical protein BGZ98_000019 [Dissophora globulifera]